MTPLRALKRHNKRVQIMGIVNRTPDSFFDGGIHLGDSAARARIEQLVAEGADIIDVGAESTKPGAAPICAQDQIDRLGDAFAWVTEAGAIASVDTTLPEVAAYAVDRGARMINSVSLQTAAPLARVAAAGEAELVLTHSRAGQAEMKGFSVYDERAYDDVVTDVVNEWCAARDEAVAAGLDQDRILFDPGLGFTKNAAQSLELCARLRELGERIGGHRVLVGTSHKSYVAKTVAAVLGVAEPSPTERLGGTIAASLDCVQRGASVVRVHDVAPVRQALAYAQAMDALAPLGPLPEPAPSAGPQRGGGDA